MKVLGSMLVLFIFALCASAQALPKLSAGPNVSVIQKKWSIDVRNPALEKEPVTDAKGYEQELREQKAAARENENRIRQGEPTLPPRVRVREPETGARGLSVTYIYEVQFTNTGEKGIRTLTWEYVFFEPGTEREVGRLGFERKVSIGPGRTRNVVTRSASSPTGTIDARKAGRKLQDLYSEQVVIKSVGYADGSVWQAASN